MITNNFTEIQAALPKGVNLLAVSKGQPASSIRSLANQGQLDFGESRLQEALPKISELKDLERIRWHFIGRLQKNKVRSVLKTFDFIHSVDSLSLAERISRIAVEEQIFPQLMLQVKLREDPSKGGFSLDDLCKTWPSLMNLSNLNFVGLMTISPLDLSLESRTNLFRECRNLANKLGLTHCSMGMSNDWIEAVKAGSTWIRVGSLLFGNRS